MKARVVEKEVAEVVRDAGLSQVERLVDLPYDYDAIFISQNSQKYFG